MNFWFRNWCVKLSIFLQHWKETFWNANSKQKFEEYSWIRLPTCQSDRYDKFLVFISKPRIYKHVLGWFLFAHYCKTKNVRVDLIFHSRCLMLFSHSSCSMHSLYGNWTPSDLGVSPSNHANKWRKLNHQEPSFEMEQLRRKWLVKAKMMSKLELSTTKQYQYRTIPRSPKNMICGVYRHK